MMTSHRHAVLMLVLCGACSGSTVQRVGSQYVKSGTFGPNGGTLTVLASDDAALAGTQIIIPPGALSAPTTIEIGVTNQEVVSSGALGPIIDFEQSGTVFALPATVTIPVTLNGLNPSRVGVMAVEPSGSSHDITAVTVTSGGASSLATFQVSGFTHYGCHDEGEPDAGCTPTCGDDATCGSSDGCGGTCNANCVVDGGCTPSCAGDAGCGSSDGCGGTCACPDAGCQPETDSFVVGPPKADVLFIVDVDDDGPQQQMIANNAADFFAGATNIDYRVAVTTDDDYAQGTYAEFGRLLPCSTCSVTGTTPTIISPSSVPPGESAPDPTTAFTQLLNSVPNAAYPTATPTDEHFFTALYNALRIGPQPGVDFFRPGVFFAAISDNGDNEADSSILAPGSHNPDWYAQYFETYFQNPFFFTWNYINPTEDVTGTGLSNILQLPPSIQQMIWATNGLAFNSTDPAWTTALGSIWTAATTASTYYTLVGTPSKGGTGIVVTVNGTTIAQLAGPGDPNWTYQATLNAIVFNPDTDPPMIGDEITVTYPVVCGGTGPTGCDVCDGGSCFSSCLEGVDPWCCGTTCVDEQTDVNNCGGCGNVCQSPATVCAGGGCACPDLSETVCGEPDAGVPLFCTDTTTDPLNCGTCGNVCANTYAIGSGCSLDVTDVAVDGGFLELSSGVCGCDPSAGTQYLCGTPGSGSCINDGDPCDAGTGSSDGGSTDGGSSDGG